MEWVWITLVVLAIPFLVEGLVRKIKRNKKSLPPGPRGLPILGHLHLLINNPHQVLHNLAKKHGPIMYLRLGLLPAIVVSSPEAAEKVLKIHDLVFANRPQTEAARYLTYGQRNLIAARYGPYWRNMRKLCILELLSNHKINSFRSMRQEEVGLMVETLRQAAQDQVAVDLSSKVSALNAYMTCRMVYGKKYEDDEIDAKGLKALMAETVEVAAAPNIGDFIPYLGALDVQVLRRRYKSISKVFDQFFEKVLDEHQQPRSSNQAKDFVDTLLEIMNSGEAEFKFDKRHVKAVLLDMLVAGMDTSAAAIDWTMSELLKSPRVLEKLQAELEQVVGMNRMVEESDVESLEYLDMVVKESLRLHPVAPLLLPHESTKDCEVNGFHIPKGSRLIVNVWAIGRDPSVWRNPEEFNPERFIGSNIDVRGHDFQLLPFGSGRRSCPGVQLGLTIVRLAVAQLIHCFNWRLADDMRPSDLDMTERFGFVVSRTNHLMAVPTYRLH